MFLNYHASIACSCAVWYDNFCESSFDEQFMPNAKLIVKGVKLSNMAHGIDFKIIDVLTGSEQDEIIRIWGDPGHLCRTYTTPFAIGDTFIFTLHELEYFGFDSIEKPGDYELPGCGLFYLHVNGNNVSGNIASPIQSAMEYNSFRQFINLACITQVELLPENHLLIFPNPAEGRVSLTSSWLAPGLYSCKLINILGEEIKVESAEFSFGTLDIKLPGVPPGLYIMTVSSEGNSLTTKLIIR